MPKVFTSKTQKIGEVGEDLACRFLMKHGFTLLDRNYTKKIGEIDIIAQKEGIIHFIEVKSVSCETLDIDVTHETKGIRPEENMHPRKIQRIVRTIQTYLLEEVTHETPWQIDLLCVYIDQKSKKAKVKSLWNIIV